MNDFGRDDKPRTGGNRVGPWSRVLNAARTLLHAGPACVKLQVDCQRVRVKIELDHGPINSPLMFALSQKQKCEALSPMSALGQKADIFNSNDFKVFRCARLKQSPMMAKSCQISEA